MSLSWLHRADALLADRRLADAEDAVETVFGVRQLGREQAFDRQSRRPNCHDAQRAEEHHGPMAFICSTAISPYAPQPVKLHFVRTTALLGTCLDEPTCRGRGTHRPALGRVSADVRDERVELIGRLGIALPIAANDRRARGGRAPPDGEQEGFSCDTGGADREWREA